MMRKSPFRAVVTGCCALMLAVALLLSGCGGGASTPDPAASNGAAGGSGAGDSPAPDSGSGAPDPGSSATGDDDETTDPVDYEVDLDFPDTFDSIYAITSRFNTVAYDLSITGEDAQTGQANVTGEVQMTWLTPGEHDGQSVERLHIGSNLFEDEYSDRMDLELWFAPGGTLVAFRSLTDADGEVVTDEFALNMIQMSTILPLTPFHSGRMILASENAPPDPEFTTRIISKQAKAETILGRSVPVITVDAETEGRGVTARVMARIAVIGNLPFLLETAGADGSASASIVATPKVMELR